MPSEIDHNICDDKVFNNLFKDFADDLYKYLYYKYGADADARDIVQEAFIKLWNNCTKVPFAKARAFLYTVANNQTLTNLAKNKTALKYAENKPKNHTSENPHYLLEEKEYHIRLEAALNELSEDQRTTFLLNRIEGKKHQEIADMLGISRKTVEKRIYTALARIREKIENI